MLDTLPIIFQDEHLIVVNKPHGLLMHPSPMARNANTSLFKILKDQLQRKLYLVHRLDRKTSGAVIVAFDAHTSEYINAQFRERQIQKTYHAIVRGYLKDSGEIDYPIKNEKGIIKEAITHYKVLSRFELDLPFGKHLTSRYSLVELSPQTGRYHQLRMHMAHIFHPIIGDRPHGCNKQNRLFKEKFELMKMMLHAKNIVFKHPKGHTIEANAEYSKSFNRILEILNNKKGYCL